MKCEHSRCDNPLTSDATVFWYDEEGNDQMFCSPIGRTHRQRMVLFPNPSSDEVREWFWSLPDEVRSKAKRLMTPTEKALFGLG